MKKPELRIDYIHDRAVIIAPRRTNRPHDVPETTIPVHPLECPFCPDKIKGLKPIFQSGNKENKIQIIKNGFPAVSLDNPKAYGYQEVIIETPSHNIELGEMPVKHLDKLLNVYQHRTISVGKIKNIAYILIFKNHGGKAGASLIHAHSQIFATGFVPPHIVLKLKNVRAYKIEHGTCYYCDTLKKERLGPRKILTNKYVTAFAPYASNYPYEAWILPNRHLDNLTRLTNPERLAFARALQHILRKLNSIRVSYNYYLHQTLTEKDEHFYLRIAPREQTWGGVEVGSRLIINSMAPEDAAKFYRS
ncbi:MAG: DUF4931 domain-containing protein [Patescibacteria group bacterium]|jgi:UDPglucose--hexose-1-phosphate uridylyltransferase